MGGEHLHGIREVTDHGKHPDKQRFTVIDSASNIACHSPKRDRGPARRRNNNWKQAKNIAGQNKREDAANLERDQQRRDQLHAQVHSETPGVFVEILRRRFTLQGLQVAGLQPPRFVPLTNGTANRVLAEFSLKSCRDGQQEHSLKAGSTMIAVGEPPLYRGRHGF